MLGVERVGVDDSFFDLGGDSISAMRLIAAINTGLDVQVAVYSIFETPTVSGLSQQLDGLIDGSRRLPFMDRALRRCMVKLRRCMPLI